MSGEYVEKLKKRAENFMKEAEEASDKDLAIFFIEQSIQIYIKAVYYEIFGEKIRGHSLRTILSMLSRSLEKQDFKEASEKINSFINTHREDLIILEEAYTESRYGELSYTEKDVERTLKIARELIKILREVEEIVKLG